MEVIPVKKAQCSDHVVYVENCLLSKQCMQIHVTVNRDLSRVHNIMNKTYVISTEIENFINRNYFACVKRK
jgi:hypothetical protein